MTVRAAEAGDADALGELLRRCGQPAPRERIAAALAALRREPGAVLLAEDWGPPAGAAALHWASHMLFELRPAYLTLLRVDPDRRREGVGRLLLKAAAQSARTAGCGELILLTDRADAEGEAFASANGFSAAGARWVRPLRKSGGNAAAAVALPEP